MNDEGLPDVLEPEPHATLWAAVERAEEACPEGAVVLEWTEE
jgi:ferredoxin